MKQKYRINLAHWNYVRDMQHMFSLKNYIKRNQSIKQDLNRCNHIIHLMIASGKRYKRMER